MDFLFLHTWGWGLVAAPGRHGPEGGTARPTVLTAGQVPSHTPVPSELCHHMTACEPRSNLCFSSNTTPKQADPPAIALFIDKM